MMSNPRWSEVLLRETGAKDAPPLLHAKIACGRAAMFALFVGFFKDARGATALLIIWF